MSSSISPEQNNYHHHDHDHNEEENLDNTNDDFIAGEEQYYYQQHQHQQQQQTESPFTSWRRLRNNPQFIQAVTTFCDYEAEVRYELALEYASWWPSNVRNFRFELLIIVERDISVELLIEREGRKQIIAEEEEEFYTLEEYWNHKQTFAFWPRWIEHAHTVLSGRIWTLESIIRNEFTHRMQIIDRSEIEERRQIIENVAETARAKEIPWGDFIPPKIQQQREEEAHRAAQIAEAQERDVELLKELYHKQIIELLKQKEDDFWTAWEAGRLRVVWAEEQEFGQIVEKCFPSSSDGFGNGTDGEEEEDLHAL